MDQPLLGVKPKDFLRIPTKHPLHGLKISPGIPFAIRSLGCKFESYKFAIDLKQNWRIKR